MTYSKVLVWASFALAAGIAPAWAADWGGVKDMGGGVAVPVPAPAPVPTFDADSDWYVGLSLGADLSQSATIKDTDINIPVRDDSDIGAEPTFGLSFGRYITPSLRWDISVDYHRGSTIQGPENSTYPAQKTAPGKDIVTNVDVGGVPTAVTVPSYDTNHYTVTRTDEATLDRTTVLASLFYDIHTGTRFTPYVGAGVGFTWRRLKRSYNESAVCDYSTNTMLPYPTDNCVINTDDLPEKYSTSGSQTKNRFDFAAAVQAGIGYAVTDNITWDNGWAMLWEGGAITSTVPTVSGESTLKYSDAVIQQFRSGIRIKFD
jgi:opacity protein-like surface antigen